VLSSNDDVPDGYSLLLSRSLDLYSSGVSSVRVDSDWMWVPTTSLHSGVTKKKRKNGLQAYTKWFAVERDPELLGWPHGSGNRSDNSRLQEAGIAAAAAA